MEKSDGQTNRPYRPREFAEKYGLGVNLVYRAVKTGEIPSIKIGDGYYIPRGPGDRLMAEGKAA